MSLNCLMILRSFDQPSGCLCLCFSFESFYTERLYSSVSKNGIMGQCFFKVLHGIHEDIGLGYVRTSMVSLLNREFPTFGDSKLRS